MKRAALSLIGIVLSSISLAHPYHRSIVVQLEVGRDGRVTSCKIVGVKGSVPPAALKNRCASLSKVIFGPEETHSGKKPIRGDTIILDLSVDPIIN